MSHQENHELDGLTAVVDINDVLLDQTVGNIAFNSNQQDFQQLQLDECDKVEELLDSASRTVSSKVDLKGGFYTEPLQSESWHRLKEADVDEHHRSSLYLHMCHPLGNIEPSSSSDRRKARRNTAPRSLVSFTPSLANVVEADTSHNYVESSPVVTSFIESAPLLSSDTKDIPKYDEAGQNKPSDEASNLVNVLRDSRTPVVSPQRMYGPVESLPRVSFILGADPDDIDGTDLSSSPVKQSLSRASFGGRRHSHRSQSSPISFRDPSLRRRLGSEVSCSDAIRRVPTESDEAAMLEDADLEVMASHRLDNTKGIRRRKISHHSAMTSVVHLGHLDAVSKITVPRKTISHTSQPHKMFVELDELRLGEDKEWAWQEKARWIKFEEEVEEDAQRWGKPRVSSLSFHSLLELRRCIEQGAIILDLDASDISTIATHVVDQLVLTDQLPPECKGQVLKALLLRHRHLDDHRPLIQRNFSNMNLFKFGQSSLRRCFHGCGLKVEKLRYVKGFSSVNTESEPVTKHAAALYTDCSLCSRRPSSVSANEMFDITDGNGGAGNENGNAAISPSNAFENSEKEPNDNKIGQIKTATDSMSSDTITPLLKTQSSSYGVPTSPSPLVHHVESNIFHRLPSGTEVTNVLVGSVDFLSKPVMAFVRLREACCLSNVTEVPLPVRFLFVVLGPKGNTSLDYHEIGRSISTLMADQRFHDIAYMADSRRDLLDAINDFLQDSIVLPPGEYNKKTLLPIVDMARKKQQTKRARRPTKELSTGSVEHHDAYGDPLKRTGNLFGGLINDVKRRYPHYASDFLDSFNFQCLAAFFFVYFACLSPAITFGGLLGDKTDKLMGVTEMLVSTAVCGIVFALLSGQPLVIIGATGPVVVFEEVLYKICTSINLDYLAFRCWVSVWIGAITFLVVMFEGSNLVRFITRFTEEIFALLISLIFVYEVFKKMYYVFLRHPLQEYYPPPSSQNCTDTEAADIYNSSFFNTSDVLPTNVTCPMVSVKYGHPNTALLSVILTGGTFLLAYSLKNFRNSQFLGRSARRAIGDFGVPISIIIMVLVDFLIPETFTEKLDVPDGINPTAPHKRNWLVNPFAFSDDLPFWVVFAGLIPALLVFILLFMEAQITSMIINKKDRNLKKGSGYHVDLFVIGMLSIFSGFFGVPFMCSAPVRSVSHVSALSVYSTTHAPGDKPKLVNVYEQRATSLAVHILIGVSALMGPILRQVPLAVLFGIFLYMGIASMTGVQLVHRLRLVFIPVKHHPEDVGYVRRVRLWKMNIYTLIQLSCLAVLWIVKSTKAALAFPFVLTLIVPLRHFLVPYLFTKQELAELDRDEESPADHFEDEPDFYTQAHMPV